jgi:hypothetical protein
MWSVHEVREADLHSAVCTLAKSTQGCNAMAHVLRWLDGDALRLDRDGREAVLTLICGAFGRHAGTARDVMRPYVPAASPRS